MTKISGPGSRSISQRHGSADPDPYQNVTDTQNGLVAPPFYPRTFEERMGGQRRGRVEKGVCSVSQDSSGEQVPRPGRLQTNGSVQNTIVPDTDLYVFGPPGSASGSVIYLYGPGCGSVYQQIEK
jgi:hypothetical protein